MSKKPRVHVIPTKSGFWRCVSMSPDRASRWQKAWDKWYSRVGWLLALAPGMWREK
jgi:hypothetical protein